jgi:serine/threonine-protein kinase
VHRDVKPHNILLLQQGEDVVAKVTDFGIARTRGAAGLTTGSAVLGSAHYLSPEQAQSRPLDGRSDLYSLGVVLYEALAGEVPFKGDVPVAVAWQHVHRHPPPLREVRPQVSPATEAVVLTAMAKNPGGRYPSAEAMALALGAARSGGAGSPAGAHLVGEPGGPGGPDAPAAVQVASAAASATAVLAGGPDAPTVVLGPPSPRAQPDARPGPRPGRPPGAGRGGRGILWGFGALVGAGLVAGGVAYWGTTLPGGGPPAAQPGSPPAATAPPAPAPTVQPTAAPPTPAPTTAPTAAPTVAPTTAPTAQPTATPGVDPAAPAEAVRAFYGLVGARQFAGAGALWSQRMRQEFPPAANIEGRFAQTQEVLLERADVVAFDPRQGRATVAVELLEVSGNPPRRRRWTGTWQVVRVEPGREGAGWLLDRPALREAPAGARARGGAGDDDD